MPASRGSLFDLTWQLAVIFAFQFLFLSQSMSAAPLDNEVAHVDTEY